MHLSDGAYLRLKRLIVSQRFGPDEALSERARAELLSVSRARGDEATLLHKMALFDIAHKYAEVMTLQELVNALGDARAGGKR